MRIASLAYRLAAAALSAGVLTLAVTAAPHSVPAAGADNAGCASLGDAGNFAVFSDGDFDASTTPGTSITGRIAAAGDVALDGVAVGPNRGEPSPEVLAGGNFTGGRAGGSGGTLTGGLSYGGSLSVAPNFTVNGGTQHAAPPFSFDDAFTSLRELSASLAELGQSPGASVVAEQYSGALKLTGSADGLNVFTVSAAQLVQATGVVIELTKPDASALINVTTDTDLTIGPEYMNISGTASASKIVWNLPLATGFAVTRGVSWKGLILAPNAIITSSGRPQLEGQMIGRSVGPTDWVVRGLASTACLPVPEPDQSLSLTALCVNSTGELVMRLRNTDTSARKGDWIDLVGGDFGTFEVPAESDVFFDVQGATAQSVIQATSGRARVTANGTDKRCEGRITIRLVTVGPAPPGQTWDVKLENGATVSELATLGSGDAQTFTVPGDYIDGAAPIDQVVGGAAYAISVPDTHGGIATIDLNPVQILHEQSEIVTVTVTYAGGSPGEAPPPEVTPPPATTTPTTPPTMTTPETPTPVAPEVPPGPFQPPLPPSAEQPTLPPGAPAPPAGPDLTDSSSGADLAITHQITPRRLPVGGTVRTVTRVRNLGDKPAVAVVAREVPQYDPSNANSVAQVLSLRTTAGKCTQRRPVRCSLGTLAPGATVTIRTRTRILAVGELSSVVVVSSKTPETNTANNEAIAAVTTFTLRPVIHVHISAPPLARVGMPVSYHVSVTGVATTVRLCSKPPGTLIETRAPSMVRAGGRYCQKIPSLARGQRPGFTITGIAAALGDLRPSATAVAVGLPRPSRATVRVHVLGPAGACSARVRPVAHAAC